MYDLSIPDIFGGRLDRSSRDACYTARAALIALKGRSKRAQGNALGRIRSDTT